jgi:hypothetical protein
LQSSLPSLSNTFINGLPLANGLSVPVSTSPELPLRAVGLVFGFGVSLVDVR